MSDTNTEVIEIPTVEVVKSDSELIAETHAMISELHAFAVQAHAAVTEMQNSKGGMMGMMMKMMSGK